MTHAILTILVLENSGHKLTFNQNFNNLVTATLLTEEQQMKTEMDNLIDEHRQVMDMDESAKSQDFFQDNNAIKVKYTIAKLKSRNFLLNIAYVGINKEDYYYRNFIFDVHLLLNKKSEN